MQSGSVSCVNTAMNLIKRLTFAKSDPSNLKSDLDQGKLIRRFGRRGRRKGQFDCPHDVTVAKTGDIVVADTHNHRIQVFSQDCHFKTKFGERGLEPENLCYPVGVAMTTSDRVVVTDSANSAVKIFTLEGKLESCIEHHDVIEFPSGVAVTSDDDIVITDICKHCVIVLTSQGEVSHRFGSYGDSSRQFDHPYYVTTNASKQIIVSDRGNSAIKIFHFQGRLLRCFYSSDFRLPSDIFVALQGVCSDSDGNTLVVCGVGIYILTKNGRLWEVITAKDGLTTPSGVVYSSSGRLIVSQFTYDPKHEICLFHYNKDDFKSLNNTPGLYAISV